MLSVLTLFLFVLAPSLFSGPCYVQTSTGYCSRSHYGFALASNAPSEPKCEIFRDQKQESQHYGHISPHPLIMNLVLDESWATFCSRNGDHWWPRLYLACYQLQTSDHVTRLDEEGRCRVWFRVGPRFGNRFMSKISETDLDLSAISCLKEVIDCYAAETKLTPPPDCVQVFEQPSGKQGSILSTICLDIADADTAAAFG